MLRFARWKIISILGMTSLAFLVIVPSLLAPATRDALIAHSPKWLPVRAIVLGLDLQGGSHVLLEVDSQSVVKTMVDNLRDSVRRVLRDEKISDFRRHRRRRRAACSCASRTPPSCNGCCRNFGNWRAPPSAPALGGAGAPVFDITTNSDGLVQIHGHRRRRQGQGPPRRRAVDRGAAPARRRARHDRTEHPARGRRPRPRRGAGPAGHRAS